MEISRLFSCTLDELLKSDMAVREDCFSTVSVVTVPAMTLAQYVVISPAPERDVQLMHAPLRQIGWDFPFVSKEQQSRFGLRGYAAGWMLPEGAEPDCPGLQIYRQGETRYARITVREPFAAAFDRIPKGYQRVMAYLGANGFKESHGTEYLPCFEEVYEREGMTYMDIYIHAECVGRANLYTEFSRER